MSAGVAYFCGSIVLAGVIAAVGLMIRKGLRDVAWHHYNVTLTGPSLRFGPAPFKTGANGSALNGHVPARAAQSHAEPRSIAPGPQGDDVVRAEAASALGVPVTTLKTNESAWGLQRTGTKGPRGSVMYTAESVNRCLASRNGTAP